MNTLTIMLKQCYDTKSGSGTRKVRSTKSKSECETQNRNVKHKIRMLNTKSECEAHSVFQLGSTVQS